MWSLKRRSTVAPLALLLVSGLAIAGFAIARPVKATSDEPWPPMTLVYRVEVRRHGAAGPFDTEVWQVTYQGVHQWRKELLQNTADPTQVGSYTSYVGTTFTDYSAFLKATVTTPNHDLPMAPEQWLIPGRDRVLEQQGYQKVAGADATHVNYVRTELLPCESNAAQRSITQPASCATAPTYQGRETIVYRTDLATPLPVEIIDQAGDIVHRHIVVTRLTMP